MEGATTRKIALEAGVNEVTLFRHFSTKENLLTAVVGRNFGAEDPRPKPVLPEATGSLRTDLTNFARFYEAMLADNLPLIRTLIGEIHRHREHERQVLDGIFRPLRTELITRLNLARERGAIRPEVETVIVADQLAGMIFTGVLRRSGKGRPVEYQCGPLSRSVRGSLGAGD